MFAPVTSAVFKCNTVSFQTQNGDGTLNYFTPASVCTVRPCYSSVYNNELNLVFPPVKSKIVFSALNFKGHGIGMTDGRMDMASLPYPKRQEDSKPACKLSETCSNAMLYSFGCMMWFCRLHSEHYCKMAMSPWPRPKRGATRC